MNEEKRVTNFYDLWIYKDSYQASIVVNTEIIPKLPKSEQFDLVDQMRRASKAVPRLIAEGYAKRHQKKGFHKYLDDAHAESNEMIVCLNHCKDIYTKFVDVLLCEKIINIYDKCSRGIFKLSIAWSRYHQIGD
jgi:four helix bundle protein